MLRLLLLTLPVVLVFTAAPCAHADIFSYDLSTDSGFNGNGGISGYIIIEGSEGDTIPALTSENVLEFSFTDLYTGSPFDQPSRVYEDSLTFNETLGASTLTGAGGTWSIGYASLQLDLYGETSGFYSANWDECLGLELSNCPDAGNYDGFWKFTLTSDVSTAPEPSTGGMSLGALGILTSGWILKRRTRVAER